MANRSEGPDEGDEIERRIASARSAIDKSLQELIARSEAVTGIPAAEAGSTGETPPPVIEAPSRSVARSGADPSERRAVEAIAAEFERRTAALEGRIGAMIADGEQRIAAVVAEAEGRLAAAEAAQAREERIRERTAAAQREAEERVREAERQLVEVLGRLAAVERRQA